jgi:hypothetical protein
MVTVRVWTITVIEWTVTVKGWSRDESPSIFKRHMKTREKRVGTVASLQHVQNVQCTPKKGNFGLKKGNLCSLKQFFSKNTLALIDFLFLHPRKFYPNDATALGNG